MALRTAHGTARDGGALLVVETLPVDELPDGVPDASHAALPAPRRPGTFQAGDPHTVASARRGGHSRRDRTALAHSLAVTTDDPEWRRCLRSADAFRRAQVRLLAATVGGGRCGPAPASLVASAALATAASRFAYSRGDLATGARLAESARGHLLGAHELCAREAAARPRESARDRIAREIREAKGTGP